MIDGIDIDDDTSDDDDDDDDDEGGDEDEWIDRDCREMVSSFFIPAANEDEIMDCALEPIRLTDRELSMEGRMEELNRALFMTH